MIIESTSTELLRSDEIICVRQTCGIGEHYVAKIVVSVCRLNRSEECKDIPVFHFTLNYTAVPLNAALSAYIEYLYHLKDIV